MAADDSLRVNPHGPGFPPRSTADGERLIAAISDLVGPLGATFPPTTEVVLHDLSKLPNSVVAIHGNVTGRRVGDPATNLLLERAAAGKLDHDIGYETKLDDGRTLQSSTLIVRDASGHPVAALCVNTDVSAWLEIKRFASMMTSAISAERAHLGADGVGHPGISGVASANSVGQGDVPYRERFPKNVDELADHLIQDAVLSIGVDVVQMKKRHKIDVVAGLQAKGLFMIKDAIEKVATALGVTRFTIYNYLNEISGPAPDSEPEPTD